MREEGGRREGEEATVAACELEAIEDEEGAAEGEEEAP